MTIRDKFEEMKEHHEGRKEYRHELREERKLERELKHDAHAIHTRMTELETAERQEQKEFAEMLKKQMENE